MSDPLFDNNRAASEGWAIWDANGELQLQKCDDHPTFETDDQAWEYVIAKAKGGSEYHMNALRYIEQHSPIEWANFSKVYDLAFACLRLPQGETRQAGARR
jgi:hypothetical protein